MNKSEITKAIAKLGKSIDYLNLKVEGSETADLSIHRETIILYPNEPYTITTHIESIPKNYVKTFKSKGGTIFLPRTAIDPFTRETKNLQGNCSIEYKTPKDVLDFSVWFFAEVWKYSGTIKIDGFLD